MSLEVFQFLFSLLKEYCYQAYGTPSKFPSILLPGLRKLLILCLFSSLIATVLNARKLVILIWSIFCMGMVNDLKLFGLG